MPAFYTYILYSPKLHKYYIGSTNDLFRRINDHNRGKSTFTKTGIPWELRHFEEFETKTQAVQREMEIKKRKDKNYIESLFR
jgi:putative endonuclease